MKSFTALAVSAATSVCVLPASVASAQLYGIDLSGLLFEISTEDASTTTIGFGSYGGRQNGSLEFDRSTGDLLTTTIGPGSQLYSIDPNTGVSSLRGATNIPFAFEGSLQFAPDGTLWGTNALEGQDVQIFRVDPDSGEATVTATLDGDFDINGLAWWDGGLIGLDGDSSTFVRIDPNTGVTSFFADLPPLTLAGGQGGMTNAFGDTASDPHASAVQTDEKPRLSASLIKSIGMLIVAGE